jgi:hypothetical protein
MATAPAKKLRWDRLLIVIVVLGGAAFAGYWFGIR